MSDHPANYPALLHHLLSTLPPRIDHEDLCPHCTSVGRHLLSLAAARAHPHGIVVLEGDYGGQSYVVAPARIVGATEAALAQLVADLDAVAWASMDGRGRQLSYHADPVAQKGGGGMGGWLIIPGVWLHAEFVWRGWVGTITQVMLGERERLDPHALDGHASLDEDWVPTWHWIHTFQQWEREARHPALLCDVREAPGAPAAERWQVVHRGSGHVLDVQEDRGWALAFKSRTERELLCGARCWRCLERHLKGCACGRMSFEEFG